MQIHQIVLRPQDNTLVLLYLDRLGHRYTIIIDVSSIPSAPTFLAECLARLPSDSENPAKEEIKKEIAGMEARLTELKEAIGK